MTDEKLDLPRGVAGTLADLATISTSVAPNLTDYTIFYDADGIASKSTIRAFNNLDEILNSIASLSYAGTEIIYSASASEFAKLSTSAFILDLLTASNQSNAQSKLGLQVGTNVQQYSSYLDSLITNAGASSSGELLYFNGSSFSRVSTSSYVRSNILNAANANAISSAIGALALTGGSSTNNAIPKFDGTSGSIQDTGIIIDDSNNITGVVNLTVTGNINSITTSQLSQFANIGESTISSSQWGYLGVLDQNLITTSNVVFNSLVSTTSITAASGSLSGQLNMNSNKIINLATPTSGTDAATKSYVDGLGATGITILEQVSVATTEALTATYSSAVLTASSNEVLTIDGQTISTLTTRVLVKNQADTKQNGVYTLTQAGVADTTPWELTRATDFNADVDPIAKNSYILVDIGTVNAATGWILSAEVTTIDTTAVVFQKFSDQLSAGNGLTSSGGALNVNTVGTSGNIYINGSDQIDINGSLSISKGGTASSSFTANKIIKVNSGANALESSSFDFDDIVILTTEQTLTNKTLNSTTNNITANALHDNVGDRVVINNTADTLNQVLKISSTSPLQAEWTTESQTVDINGLSAITSTQNSDELILYDSSNTSNRKITIENFISAIPSAIPAGTINVASSGGDYTTISAAITASVAGDTIVVFPGTYSENLTIDKNIRIIGWPTAQQVIINGADTTTSRITFTVSVTSATLRECTVYAPSSGSNYAVNLSATPSNTLIIIDSIIIIGTNASASGIYCSSLGVTEILNGLYHNGGALNNLIYVDGGKTIAQNIICNTGSSVNVINLSGGTLHGNGLQLQSSSLYSTTDVFDISSGTMEFATIINNNSPSNTNSLHISGDGVNISLSNVHLHSNTYDILVDGDLTGASTILKINGEFDIEKTSFPSGWKSTAKYNVLYLDDGENDDLGIKIEGSGFIVGTPNIPTESVFGEGDSTTLNMNVFRSTDVTDIAGATYVNYTTEAKAAESSTFTIFAGLTSGNGLFIGNTERKFSGCKIDITTALVAGSGILTWWYYNGSSWIEFDIMSTKDNSPYTHYANLICNAVHSEQIRFDWNTINTNWASTTVNGIAAYWVYVRIGRASANTQYPLIKPQNTNSITTSPILERIKLHTHRFEINGDGVNESFGNAQPYNELIKSEIKDVSNTSAASISLSISSNITLDIPYSKFAGDAIDGHGYTFSIPKNLDTSRGLDVNIYWAMDGSQTGDVWLSGYLVQSIIVGSDIKGGTLSETKLYDRDNLTNAYDITTIGSDQTGIIKLSPFHVILPSANTNSISLLYIYRDAQVSNDLDTNSGAIDIFKVEIKGYLWC